MLREKTLGELVTFENSHGFHLDGILYQEDHNKTTIIHIHGSLGNFYQNQFLRLMAKMYNKARINFLSFNLASHDGLAEGYRNVDDFEYVGGSVVDFETSLLDIEAAINFVKKFSRRIILQGHSLGCDRVLNYLITQESYYDFILLSPCDSYQLQACWIAPETVEQQMTGLKAINPGEEELDWLPSQEYGIKHEGEDYIIPITRKALLSIIDGPPFKLIRIGNPAHFTLNQKVLVYIGGEDALQVVPNEIMFKYFEDRVRHVTKVFIPRGQHSLEGCEHEVAEHIIKWSQT